jgi:predicted PurR-regulated permease PerM
MRRSMRRAGAPTGHAVCPASGVTADPLPERRLLQVLLAAVSVALLVILVPFFGTLLWSVIVALLFRPLFRRLMSRLGGRRTAAAAVTTLAVFVIVVMPFVVVTLSLINEAAALYERVQRAQQTPASAINDMFAALPVWATDLMHRAGIPDLAALQRRLFDLLGQGGQIIGAQALKIGQNTFNLVASLFIMLYVSFFLIRDGDGLVRSLREAVPLSASHQQELFGKFSTAIRATVKGNMLVALLQGTLGGIAFWFLDIRGALLWAVVMAFVSLLPAIGAALVWLPVAIWFLATGDLAKGVGLIAWGSLVIGLVDNLLRPVLVGKDTRLPDWVVLITTLGGMSVFGIHGFVLGPMIAAMFFAVWHIVMLERRTRLDAATRASLPTPPP